MMDAEAIADRHRLRRKLTFWRVAGVLGLIIAVGTAGYFAANRTGVARGRDHIARIFINGVITGNQRLADLMRDVGDARSVSAVVDLHQLSRRHHHRVRGALPQYPGARRQEASRGLRGRDRGLRRLHHGDGGGPYRGPRYVPRGIDRRPVPVPGRVGPARPCRRQGRGREVGAPQGRAQRLQVRPARRPARRSSRWSTIPTAGSSVWSRSADA